MIMTMAQCSGRILRKDVCVVVSLNIRLLFLGLERELEYRLIQPVTVSDSVVRPNAGFSNEEGAKTMFS
jgi:hypothetical protein